ncbi:MAG: hypothetical protein JJ916_04135 [Phycisphaerales bacterium]|nr:hypothetical protein [Phycisphaerales bacterium]
MDASTELNELWELLDKGRHQAWPECICPLESDRTPSKEDKYQSEWWYEGWASGTRIEKAQHALAIVRDSVEGWLLEQGWAVCKDSSEITYAIYRPRDHERRGQRDVIKRTLPDAVRYAMESTTAT